MPPLISINVLPLAQRERIADGKRADGGIAGSEHRAGGDNHRTAGLTPVPLKRVPEKLVSVKGSVMRPFTSIVPPLIPMSPMSVPPE